MKRKSLLAGLALSSLLCLSACRSGPNRMARSWDNHVNQKYSEDAWVHGALLQDILPIYPIVGLVAGVGDVLFVNPYFFWIHDLRSRQGTAFVYTQPEGSQKEVSGWRSPFSVGH